MIVFDHVTKYYETSDGENLALDDMSLHIKKGEFVFVLGHSGAGKSTFLKMILREEVPTKGNVYVAGLDLVHMKKRDVPYLRRRMGVVFQDFRLIPTMTAYENVAFAMRVTNIPEEEIRVRVPYALSLVGLKEKADRLPEELSGGEQQRVALARAVVHSPKLIIADEPTGNIDPELSKEMMELLQAINNVGPTVVVVTHEHELVQEFDKRVITIEHGKIVSDTGSPEDAEQPGDAFTAQKPSGKSWPCVHAGPTLYAGFPHFHFYANPSFAIRFLDACRREKTAPCRNR